MFQLIVKINQINLVKSNQFLHSQFKITDTREKFPSFPRPTLFFLLLRKQCYVRFLTIEFAFTYIMLVLTKFYISCLLNLQ